MECSKFIQAIGYLRLGLIFKGLFTVLRVPCYFLIIILGLRLRGSLAKLPPQELSDFLCQTVIVKGIRTKDEIRRSEAIQIQQDQRSQRVISSGELQDGFAMGALV
ncbi:hypothetical protein TrST_g7217 [Triparma strigata]|uniref:Uncharacterized protein n=1 Tax=Triparma strigata TaxID=1606541 RepID=A0A9W6ZPV1_9STRA|nr:hypothetical protein TrST_g7217 [Triparma strigata]